MFSFCRLFQYQKRKTMEPFFSGLCYFANTFGSCYFNFNFNTFVLPWVRDCAGSRTTDVCLRFIFFPFHFIFSSRNPSTKENNNSARWNNVPRGLRHPQRHYRVQPSGSLWLTVFYIFVTSERGNPSKNTVSCGLSCPMVFWFATRRTVCCNRRRTDPRTNIFFELMGFRLQPSIHSRAAIARTDKQKHPLRATRTLLAGTVSQLQTVPFRCSTI